MERSPKKRAAKQSSLIKLEVLAPVVQKVDNAIHRINLYPLDSAIRFPNTYLLDNDLEEEEEEEESWMRGQQTCPLYNTLTCEQ